MLFFWWVESRVRLLWNLGKVWKVVSLIDLLLSN